MQFWKPLLDMVIIGPKFLMFTTLFSTLVLGYLLLKKRSWRWFGTAATALVLGIGVGLGLLVYVGYIDNTFGDPLLPEVWFWVPAAFAALALVVANLFKSRWWRKTIALLSVVAFVATAAFQINAAYGINPTLGALLNINTAATLQIPPRGSWAQSSAQEEARPLYERWEAPAGMPEKGERGRTPVNIPNSHSHFPARWAGLYLPPAALVENAPRLPLMIFMMGQPGSPSTTGIGDVADAEARKHHGLTPIILVIDQLADPTKDPLCLNSNRGQVESYVMQDVVPWARTNLPVLQDRKHWSIVGYSNGGACSSYYAAKYPQVFGSYGSVSGEPFMGSEKPADVLATVFNGNQKAYDAVKPLNIMKAHGKYTDMVGVYTAGTLDGLYTKAGKASAATARKSGIHTTFTPIQGAGHVKGAVDGGLTVVFEQLYARWGLAAR